MPYSIDHIGIYKIVNKATGLCYVGQSQRVKKRIKEHFRLLRKGVHPNQKLQRAFDKYGEESFDWSMEVECQSFEDLDQIEEMFLKGEAKFDEPTFYNIADFAKAPMRGKQHTEETKKKIRAAMALINRNFNDPSWREKLKEGQRKRNFENPDFVAKVKFLVDNPDMTYAERGRKLGIDTSSARKLALKYSHLKGVL